MEVYFADVGQGTSNVILVGKKRAIVIDTGKPASDLRLLLRSLNVDTLTLLAISHLDADHVGGAPAILTEFRGRIERVCYPNDHRVLETSFWEKLQAELDDGHIDKNQLVRMEYENTPKTLWKSLSLRAELKVFSPTFGENQAAMKTENTNAMSGVLVLKVGSAVSSFPATLVRTSGEKFVSGAGLLSFARPLPCHTTPGLSGHGIGPRHTGRPSCTGSTRTESVRRSRSSPLGRATRTVTLGKMSSKRCESWA